MPDDNAAREDKTYIDRPAPSAGMVFWLIFGACGCIAPVPVLVAEMEKAAVELSEPGLIAVIAVLAVSSLIVCFYFWPMYATSYAIGPAGIAIKYGPWKRSYAWDDFDEAYRQRGMFTTKVGWPSVTPCVRLSDCVTFKRKKGWRLHITPNDSCAFLRKVAEFAPELTRRAIF
ncbi:MAG: hypothetical protein ACYSU0_00235 [Planctomycetota bacterium]|jgi:hypothetical protein